MKDRRPEVKPRADALQKQHPDKSYTWCVARAKSEVTSKYVWGDAQLAAKRRTERKTCPEYDQ